ncbi:HAD domain-containing protein [Paraburkholderia madseniana]|uniref:HAD domain-containing protein n=1 Tax=Paraburkholderia madseniana TaxID=2599607 RepID=UPI0038BAC945
MPGGDNGDEATVRTVLTGLPGPTFRIPPPRRTGGLILYLDYDGVLHPEGVYNWPGKGPYIANPPGHRLFEHAALLERVLLPYPDVRIVLSTSWVRVYRGVVKPARWLPQSLRSRVIGATFHTKMDKGSFDDSSRGMQIWSDVLRRRPDKWIAVDDDDLGWPPWCRENLVLTHEILGISKSEVLAELETKLATMRDA